MLSVPSKFTKDTFLTGNGDVYTDVGSGCQEKGRWEKTTNQKVNL